MYAVELEQVSKKYNRTVIADKLDLKIRDKTFSVIFGVPGSGKSTLLRLITGLEKPDSGRICLRGEDATKVPPGERNIGYVPQSFALYPHYKVFDNIAYPLKLMGVAEADYRPVVEQTAQQLQIDHLLDKTPDQCSGGEKQRIAIARGIVKDTEIFILDDPLVGLDFKLREQLFDDLREMQADLGATFIYTTSDPLEALMLAEEVHIFDMASIVENGGLEEIYQDPQHVRTIQLLGFPKTNILDGTLQQEGGRAICKTPIFSFEADADAANTQDIKVAVRPQDIIINPTNTDGMITADVEITLVEDLGGELHIYLEANDIKMETVSPHNETKDITEGDATIGVSPAQFRIYRANDSQFIGKGAS